MDTDWIVYIVIGIVLLGLVIKLIYTYIYLPSKHLDDFNKWSGQRAWNEHLLKDQPDLWKGVRYEKRKDYDPHELLSAFESQKADLFEHVYMFARYQPEPVSADVKLKLIHYLSLLNAQLEQPSAKKAQKDDYLKIKVIVETAWTKAQDMPTY